MSIEIERTSIGSDFPAIFLVKLGSCLSSLLASVKLVSLPFWSSRRQAAAELMVNFCQSDSTLRTMCRLLETNWTPL